MAEKLTFVCSKFCRKIENVQISKKHHIYRTAGGVSRQRLSPRIIPLCHYRGFSSAASASAAAIETRATPHCRLSGCCSNLSYLFAKYFYHRCSYNVADSKVWCLHRIFLRTKQCRAHLMLYSIMRIVQHLMCGRCVIINVIMI